MAFLSRFFAEGIDPGLLLYGTYNPWLVALSVSVAVFSSSMGLHAAHQARALARTRLRQITLLAGSLSLGCGVWAMHFIGMLAFQLCTPVTYNTAVTLLSVLPSLGASWVALNLLSQPSVTHRQLLISGTLVGGGIGAMHYTGMAAMGTAAVLRYDPGMFGLSLVVAVSLAVLALWVRFRLASAFSRQGELMQTSASGVVMGLAIAGMHYTGMAAARFVGTRPSGSGLALNDPIPLALSITLVTLLSTAVVAAATGLSQYRQIVRQLRVKEARLRAITDTSTDAIIVFDEQGLVHEFNPAAERIYGWPAAEMIGHSVTVIMVEPHRSVAERSFAAFLGDPTRSMGVERETLGVHRDGRHIPIRLVIGRMPKLDRQLYVAYVSDISERQAMQLALRDSEAQFRSLIANIPGISYRCRAEPGWPAVYISEAFESVTGYPPSLFLGPQATMRFADLLAPQDVIRLTETLKDARKEGRRFVLEFQLRHRDGSLRWMWGHGSVVRSEDDAVQWVDGVLLDITERHAIEAALLQAKDKAEAAVAARSTFLANMSHEIRTPMNAILGFTEVVLAGDLPTGPRKHLETVYKSARSLLHLLNDILDTSKLERGVVELEMLDFSVPELVQQLCAEQSLQAQRKQLQLRCHIHPDVGDMVCGDPHRLRQVLLNLLGNAIKFTHQGQVHLRVSRAGDLLHFEIRDTGIGIPPEQLPHIFDAFTQADASMSRRFGGTGLGTTISKQLVDLMQGRIWVDSTVGQGSTFHVLVPLPKRSVPHSLANTPPPLSQALPSLRILAVDDVPLNLELIHLLLEDQACHILDACHGQEALDILTQPHERVDVVLMDVQMPVLDGLSACRRLREWEHEQGRPPTPVIGLSASVRAEDRQAALAAGMDGFAGKPLDLNKLIEEIARVTSVSLTPITRPLVTPPSPPEHDPRLIDTEQAHQRWGDIAAYQQSLRHFAQDNLSWLTEPHQQPAPTDTASAAATAHRLKGVAANLALLGVERAARQVEVLLSQHSPAATASAPMTAVALDAAWFDLRRAMQDTLTLIAHMLPAPAPVHAAPSAPPPTTPNERNNWQHQAARLRSAFLRGERLDELLQQFCHTIRPRVPASQLQALEQAIDDFDFEAAAACLDRLIQSLPTTGDEHAVL